jgi:hypothetical protein
MDQTACSIFFLKIKVMENIRLVLSYFFEFGKYDFNLFSAKNGITSAIGAFGGAFYEGREIFYEGKVAVNQISFSYIYEIALTALIGLVVTFIGRKIITALWDHVITVLWERLKRKIFKTK